MEQRKRPKILNIQRFNQPLQVKRKNQNQRRMDANVRRSYHNTSNNANYSTRQPVARYNTQMHRNQFKRSVPFAGDNRPRNFNARNERLQHGNNVSNRSQQLRRVVNSNGHNERLQRKNNIRNRPQQLPKPINFGSSNERLEHRNNVSDRPQQLLQPAYLNGHNEGLQHRNNVSNNRQQLPRVINDERIKPLVKVERRKSQYNPQEEARLSRIIFGDPSDIIDKLADEVVPEYLGEDTSETVEQDSTEESIEHNESSDEDEHDTDDQSDAGEGRRVAWVDEDDMKFTVLDAVKMQKTKIVEGWTETYYQEMLENKYKKLVGTPKWAEFDNKLRGETDELDDEILKHATHLGKSTGKGLPKEIIELKAMSLLNKQTHNEGPIISSLEFHPTSTVGLVAGSSGNISIFQVDGIENNKLHTMHYKKFPISKATFLREGTEILSGSQFFPHCHSYNLLSGKSNRILLPHGITSMKRFEVSPDGKLIALCGRSGEVYLLTASSKELIGQLKMNAKCRALAFSPNSKTLITHGDCSEMCIWDVNSRTCMHRAVDDGCISCESIAVSPNGQFVATGSKQGAVNVYEMDAVLNQCVPTPVKIVLNLVTSITSLKFNPTSEILAMASDKKHNAFKMMHIPSFNIFSNFPTFQTRLNMPEIIEFSPGSGYLGISNRSHSAFLFRLRHYNNY